MEIFLNKFNSPVYLKDQKDKVIVTITENKSESGLLRFQILGKNQEPKIWKNLTLQQLSTKIRTQTYSSLYQDI